MTENNAAQAVSEETRQAMAKALSDHMGQFSGDGYFRIDPFDDSEVNALLDAALSKLRAEGVQAGVRVANTVVRQCPRCTGNGTILRLSGNGPDAYDVQEECSHCEGSGVVASAPVASDATPHTPAEI
jgi:hypothetical protein